MRLKFSGQSRPTVVVAGSPGAAYCTFNGHFFFNFLLKMQRLWRISPENDDFLLKKRPLNMKSAACSRSRMFLSSAARAG